MASDRIQRRIERLLDQIEQEADQRNWQLVRDLAEEALGFAPDNSDAKAFLEVAEERLARIAGQEDLFLASFAQEVLNLIAAVGEGGGLVERRSGDRSRQSGSSSTG